MDGDDCVVCLESNVKLWAYFNCGGEDHRCCHRCALVLRLRPRDESRAQLCPLCQQPSPTITISDSTSHPSQGEDELVWFNDQVATTSREIAQEVDYLTGYYCPAWQECGCQTPFKSMKELQKHLERAHGRYMCQTCVDHKPAFVSEQTLYKWEDLKQHNNGTLRGIDPPEFSGHVKCLFCHEMIYDKEALLTHMQQVHYPCSLCVNRGVNLTFYKDEACLLQHSRDKHAICKECEVVCQRCPDRHFSEYVFEDQIALDAHRCKVHGHKRKGAGGLVFGCQSYGADRGRERESASATAAHGAEDRITFDFLQYTKTVMISEFQGNQGNARPAPASSSPPPSRKDDKILRRLRDMLDGDASKFNCLRMQVQLFLGNKMQPTPFFHSLRDLFGAEALGEVMPELLETLPNESGKREVLRLVWLSSNRAEPSPPPPAPAAAPAAPAAGKGKKKKGKQEQQAAETPAAESATGRTTPPRQPGSWARAAGATNQQALDADFPALGPEKKKPSGKAGSLRIGFSAGRSAGGSSWAAKASTKRGP